MRATYAEGPMAADTPRQCAVLGSPIAHSLSPVIHQAAYSYLGLPWRYTAHDVGEDALAAFVEGLDARWRGLSLTMPLKQVALRVADDASDLARTVGAANTLIRAEDGTWVADNTDVGGARAALRERGVDSPNDVCLWGGGATAASILTALAFMNAGSVHVHVRSAVRARPTLAVAGALMHPASLAPWGVGPQCRRSDLVVSATPAGATDSVADALVADGTAGRALFEVVYDPWPTALAARWAGGVVVSGLDLLVHQAVAQVALMTGREVPVRVLREAAEAALAARQRP